MRIKLLLTLFIVCFSALTKAEAGIFVKASLGPGYMNENEALQKSGFIIIGKNHAVGWEFNNKYGFFYGEFGAFIKKDVGDDYNYINLDAYGLGISYRFPGDIIASMVAAYSQVHFDKKWYKANSENNVGDGYGFNFALEKEYMLSKKFSIGHGVQLFYIDTEDSSFQFLCSNIFMSARYYFGPVGK